MAEDWIILDVAERRKNWWVVGYFTTICVGVAVAVAVSAGSGVLWWVFSIAGAWLMAIGYIINRGYGRTLVTPEGIFTFNGVLGGKVIRWADVVDIEKRRHAARSSSWWDLRVTVTSGSSLAIPGAFTSKLDDEKFDAKLALLHQYWRQANR
ncbi:PH domain-containing protein [Streptomyces albidoflavus]|uniref:PH domain-containing protein n=1 Tax=Streptomyces albidoflavus TaxID=1886 RepID=UPI000F4FD8C4|nr:hypothetical protein [Streptomyces albidoflavus]